MIAKGCVKFVLIPFCIFTFCASGAIAVQSIILFIPSFFFATVTIFCILFFRDPNRKIGGGIVSPADGRVLKINNIGVNIRIAIFMNVYDVHVNRAPIGGKVISIKSYGGTYLPAYSDRCERNARIETILSTEIGNVKIVQISGIFARRILSYIKKGEVLSRGQRIGIVLFGSRVDVYLPKQMVKVVVKKDMKVYAGITTIARFAKC
jgi:phosphatidylserine decarboxylase